MRRDVTLVIFTMLFCLTEPGRQGLEWLQANLPFRQLVSGLEFALQRLTLWLTSLPV